MRITFLGHAGLHVATAGGSILCDPFFTPAYFGSWFPFPRNDGLDPGLLEAIGLARPDFLYVSHLHRDHFDPGYLARHVDKGARVLLPDFPAPFLERELRAIGFEHFVRTRHAEPVDLDGVEIAILAMTEPADGPLGDSALVVADASARVLDQNDARPGDPGALQALGPYDAHFVQFSGAIWYPIVYEMPEAERRRLGAEKRVNQMDRAQRYIEWVKAAHVFPSAGPPCFLDDELVGFNDVDGDPANIFPDQTVFLERLAAAGIDDVHLALPGTVIELAGDGCSVRPPVPAPGAEFGPDPFTAKAEYLAAYRRDWNAWLTTERESWSTERTDLVAELRTWFAPLLEAAPVTSAGIAGNVVIDTGELAVCIDFVESTVREWSGEPFVYRIEVDRRLVETLVAGRVEDWVNSLFLSCRFRAQRPGPFNEYVMTFFKALGPERMEYVERSYAGQHRADEFFERDGWRIERYCPHRQADLTRFGEVADGVLTCSLHHWQFDLESGRCLTSDDRHLRCSRVADG